MAEAYPLFLFTMGNRVSRRRLKWDRASLMDRARFVFRQFKAIRGCTMDTDKHLRFLGAWAIAFVGAVGFFIVVFSATVLQ